MTKVKKNPVKQMTLRQHLRAEAQTKLAEIEKLVRIGVERALEEAGVELNPADVMRLCLGGQTKTVKEQLITDLANSAEAELLRIWNNQQDLPLGDEKHGN
jgi:hypothetical protein